jgi:threonine aldolase
VYYRPQTALICLENTVNMAGGTVLETKIADGICERAHAAGIRVHLDGARIFNAATHLNERVADMTKNVDSVQFCLSKGLGAPVGSMIVGSREFIEQCRSIRKMLGGGMRQAGVLAAAGLVALENGPERLKEDHDNAKVLANLLARIPGVILNPEKVHTNIVIFSLKGSGVSSSQLLQKLAAQRVLAVPVDDDRIRMVTHLDVTREEVERAAQAVGEALVASPLL